MGTDRSIAFAGAFRSHFIIAHVGWNDKRTYAPIHCAMIFGSVDFVIRLDLQPNRSLRAHDEWIRSDGEHKCSICAFSGDARRPNRPVATSRARNLLSAAAERAARSRSAPVRDRTIAADCRLQKEIEMLQSFWTNNRNYLLALRAAAVHGRRVGRCSALCELPAESHANAIKRSREWAACKC